MSLLINKKTHKKFCDLQNQKSEKSDEVVNKKEKEREKKGQSGGMCWRLTINGWLSQLSQGVHTLGVSVSVFVCACLCVPTHVKSAPEKQEACRPSSAALRPFAFLPCRRHFFSSSDLPLFPLASLSFFFCFGYFFYVFADGGWISFFFFSGSTQIGRLALHSFPFP